MFDDKNSSLKANPKSRVVEEGYINIYSELTPQEERQLYFKEKYKRHRPKWDDSLVYLSRKFSDLFSSKRQVVILDLGCGNGNYVVDENRKIIDWAVGLDVSEEQTKNNICLDEIFYGNSEVLPFPSKSFDAVISLWVLEHLENPERVFEEVSRVLKPGGYFLFSAPNKKFIPLKFAKLFNLTPLPSFLNKSLFGREEDDVFPTYYRANTLRDIRKILPRNLEIIEMRYNFDPSYTSFGSFTYNFTETLADLLTIVGLNFFNSHIVGVIQKQP